MNGETKSEETTTVLQAILEDAKKEGLDMAEDAAKQAVDFIYAAAPKLITLIKNPTIQMVVGIVVTALVATKPALMAILDKIDGQVG